MHLDRTPITKRLVRTSTIVKHHCFANSPANIRLPPKTSTKPVLLLEKPIETLGLAVLIAMILLGHTDTQTITPQPLNISTATILAAVIRMMNRLTPARKIL
jgi:hypothetical protein